MQRHRPFNFAPRTLCPSQQDIELGLAADQERRNWIQQARQNRSASAQASSRGRVHRIRAQFCATDEQLQHNQYDFEIEGANVSEELVGLSSMASGPGHPSAGNRTYEAMLTRRVQDWEAQRETLLASAEAYVIVCQPDQGEVDCLRQHQFSKAIEAYSQHPCHRDCNGSLCHGPAQRLSGDCEVQY
jgi:hypothetical protein